MVNKKQTRSKAVLWKTRKVGKNGSRMRQTALINFIHVTARLQLIHCFKLRTSHELNFNTQFQLPSFLPAVKYNSIFWLIHKCNVHTQFIQKQAQILRWNANYFWCRLPRRQHVCTLNQENPNCTYRLNLLSRAKPAIFIGWRSADAQFILLRILSSSKYIKNTLN